MSDWNCTSPISIGQVQNVLLKQEKFSRERRNSIIDDKGGREGDPKEGHYIETVLTLHLSLCLCLCYLLISFTKLLMTRLVVVSLFKFSRKLDVILPFEYSLWIHRSHPSGLDQFFLQPSGNFENFIYMRCSDFDIILILLYLL